MALDVYFKEDVKNILRAALLASEGSAGLISELLSSSDLDQAAASKLVYMYKQGFASALGSIALAFGLDMPPPAQQWQVKSPPSSRVFTGGVRRMSVRDSGKSLAADDLDDGLEEFDLAGFLWAKSEHERQRG